MPINKTIKSAVFLCKPGVYCSRHQGRGRNTSWTGHQSFTGYTHPHSWSNLKSSINQLFTSRKNIHGTCKLQENHCIQGLLVSEKADKESGSHRCFLLCWKWGSKFSRYCVILLLCWHGGCSVTVQQVRCIPSMASVGNDFKCGLQTVIPLLHYQVELTQRSVVSSTLKQPNSRSLNEDCCSSYPTCLQEQFLFCLKQRIELFSAGSGPATPPFKLENLEWRGKNKHQIHPWQPQWSISMRGHKPAMAWINDTLHCTKGSLQYLDLHNSWQCTEHQLQSTIQGELYTAAAAWTFISKPPRTFKIIGESVRGLIYFTMMPVLKQMLLQLNTLNYFEYF